MQQTQWSPPTFGIAGCGIAGLMMAIAAVTLITDGPGRVIASVAAVGLLAFATFSWRARPKLAITEDGLTVAGLRRVRTLRRNEVQDVRITEFRRIGRRTRLLELDTADDRLLVFTRWDLGTDPARVLEALRAAGY